MGLFGIGKGIFKVVTGIATGDSEEILKGAKKIVINTATTIATNEAEERLTKDDDD